ncbi:MAG: SPASM domain-containing protein, partial [Cyanobacteria bacterium REEB65]|nr:SPASM domain-containing protein [Cyanobacteria bacterium REEB65]
SHDTATRWIGEILKRTRGKTFRVDALLTVTRHSLPAYKEIVDEYVALGSKGIYLRSLNPFGLARETWKKIGYSAEEFLEFYEKALDYIISLNGKKVFFEQSAKIFLAKILGDDDPNFLDLRSPCGAGIGQVAYNFDGSVYTCDEGRMMGRMGDDSFKIGAVGAGSYSEMVSHEAVKALAVASCLDNQVDCSQCAYKPYCGVCPIQCYAEQGDIMGRMPLNARCKVNKGILDILFTRLQDEKTRKIFQTWLKKKEDFTVYQRH